MSHYSSGNKQLVVWSYRCVRLLFSIVMLNNNVVSFHQSSFIDSVIDTARTQFNFVPVGQLDEIAIFNLNVDFISDTKFLIAQ